MIWNRQTIVEEVEEMEAAASISVECVMERWWLWPHNIRDDNNNTTTTTAQVPLTLHGVVIVFPIDLDSWSWEHFLQWWLLNDDDDGGDDDDVNDDVADHDDGDDDDDVNDDVDDTDSNDDVDVTDDNGDASDR